MYYSLCSKCNMLKMLTLFKFGKILKNKIIYYLKDFEYKICLDFQ